MLRTPGESCFGSVYGNPDKTGRQVALRRTFAAPPSRPVRSALGSRRCPGDSLPERWDGLGLRPGRGVNRAIEAKGCPRPHRNRAPPASVGIWGRAPVAALARCGPARPDSGHSGELKRYHWARILPAGHALVQKLRCGHHDIAPAPDHRTLRVAFDPCRAVGRGVAPLAQLSVWACGAAGRMVRPAGFRLDGALPPTYSSV
jgi:hypothetical protein